MPKKQYKKAFSHPFKDCKISTYFCLLVRFQFPIILLLVILLFACKQNPSNDKKVKVIATTNIIGNCLENMLDSHQFSVQSLMGPGIDPHKYKASHSDIKLLNSADVIVYNGLHLEGKMSQILEKLSKTRQVVAVSEAIDKKEFILVDSQAGLYDPHFWFNLGLWRTALDKTVKQIQKWYPNIDFEKANKYLAEIDSTNMWAKSQLLDIPEDARVLITSHDAFHYFGNSYNIQVKALQGISTVSEFGLKDIVELIDFIAGNQIPSIFIENSINPKSINSVIQGARKKGHEVALGGELFSDALGDAQNPEGTYVGMIKYNVRTIKKGLNHD